MNRKLSSHEWLLVYKEQIIKLKWDQHIESLCWCWSWLCHFCAMYSFCTKRTTKYLALFIPVPWAFLVEEDNANLFELGIFTYVIASMIRQPCCQTRTLRHATTSMNRKHYHQHDSSTTSCRGQAISATPSPARLGRTITSMNRHLHRVLAKSPQQPHRQHDLTTPSPGWLSRDIMQRFDHQHQQYITSVASRYAASSYWYYSPLCLVLGPIQTSCCATWHLREASTFWRFMFEDFKLQTPELNSLKDLIRESEATPNRCTYAVPLLDQLGKKALNDFVP
jgi:hypothetical protein